MAKSKNPLIDLIRKHKSGYRGAITESDVIKIIAAYSKLQKAYDERDNARIWVKSLQKELALPVNTRVSNLQIQVAEAMALLTGIFNSWPQDDYHQITEETFSKRVHEFLNKYPDPNQITRKGGKTNEK